MAPWAALANVNLFRRHSLNHFILDYVWGISCEMALTELGMHSKKVEVGMLPFLPLARAVRRRGAKSHPYEADTEGCFRGCRMAVRARCCFLAGVCRSCPHA